MQSDHLTLYRRHLKNCRHKAKGQSFQSCQCAIWAYGALAGKPFRQSLHLRDWARAEAKIKRWIEQPQQAADETNAARTLKDAIQDFLRDCERRQLSHRTIEQARIILERQLLDWASKNGLRTLGSLDSAAIARYLAGRKIAGTTQAKELRYISWLLSFAKCQGWISENPAVAVKPPKTRRKPVMPFTRDEVMRLLRACDGFGQSGGSKEQQQRVPLRACALILMMYYSGMRIGDIVQLRRERLNLRTGELLLRTEKADVGVYLTLHPDAVAALMALPAESEYFFWNGSGDPDGAIANCRRAFARLCKRAQIVKGHPHRMRHTFAIELLLAGTDIRTVQRLMGHKSVLTTERHYASFVAAEQVRLNAAIAKLPSISSGVLPVVAGENAGGDSQTNILPFAAAR